MQIIGSPLSPYTARVSLQMALKQCPLELIPRPEDFLERHPLGKIPVLLTGQGPLVESVSIMEYLEETEAGAASLLPETAHSRARMRQVIGAFDLYVLHHMMPLFHKLFGLPKTDEEVETAATGLATEMARVSALCDGEADSLLGTEVSLADCAVAPFLPVLDALAIRLDRDNPLRRVDRINNWWERFSERPEVRDMGQRLTAAFGERFPLD